MDPNRQTWARLWGQHLTEWQSVLLYRNWLQCGKPPTEGLRSTPVLPCHCHHKVLKRGKTKDDFQAQNSIMLQPRESPFHWLDHFLSLLEPAQGFGEYLQPGNGKKVFTVSRMASSCYWAKALLFPVVIHYIKVVRAGDKNNKVIKETQMTRAD